MPRMSTPSFRDAFRFWLKLGFISFGGPTGQIAIMHTELVDRKKWIDEETFLHALNFCMLLPGPEATQLATYFFGVWSPVIVAVAATIGWIGFGAKRSSGGVENIPAPTAGFGRAAKVLATCLALWWTPVLIAGLVQGWDGVLAREGFFFS